MLQLQIDRDSPVPGYEQIAGQLRRLIYDGLLPAGTKLPSMRILSTQLGVSLNTVYAACDLLAAEHLIETRRGSGSFVAAQPAVASGVNLRTLAELPNELLGLVQKDWEAYRFPNEYFLIPPPPPGQELISFAKASPDPAMYPFERIKQIATSMLWTPKELFFDRGHPQGYQPLVELLEKQMALRGVPMAAGENEIVLTGGFQRALSTLLHLLLRPGQQVAVEAPTYSAIINLLQAERIGCRVIPLDAEGMDTAALEAALAAGSIGAIITIPTFHNPTGICMSHERRLSLLRLAARHDVPVIEDDWGSELRYDGNAPPSLKALDPGGYVIQIASFSKTFLPGLRLAWVTCPSRFALTFVSAKHGSDNGDSFFLQALMHEFIRRGHYARHLRHSISEYRKRRDALCRLLREQLPPDCRFVVPEGGFNVWLELPLGQSACDLQAEARRAGVDFLPGAYCMPDRSDVPALRLAFSRCSIEEIERGIPQLCAVINASLNTPATKAGRPGRQGATR